jgi:hypothetical protein
MSKKIKYYHRSGEVTLKNGTTRKVTIVGKFEQTRKPTTIVEDAIVDVYPGKYVDGTLMFSRKILERKLTLGMAICAPSDKFDEEYGIKLAKKRINQGINLGTVYTNDVTMLTKDACEAELENKFKFISNNLEKYIPAE